MDKIKVLVVDDHPVVRDGLHTMLVTAPDIQVIAEACDGVEAVVRTAEHRPQVVLMDLRLPNLDGLEAMRRIKAQFPATAVIVLTVFDNEVQVMNAMKAGADGYLLKDSSRELIIHTIRAVNSGGTLIKGGLLRQASGSLAQVREAQPKGQSTSSALWDELTPREREVLRLLTLGLSNKELAQALSISSETAKKHVQAIMLKLGVSDRAKAAVKAMRANLFHQDTEPEQWDSR